MSDPLDDQYLEWLYNQVGRQAENVDHWKLLQVMNSYEFVALPEAPNDNNRCKDGEALRGDFVVELQVSAPHAWMTMGCSVLEMLVGLARHLSFEMDGDDGEWFWHLVNNLGLIRYNDKRFNARWIDQVLERLVWRQYSYDGNGGLFPLKQPHQDQREVELWFQMESYLLEID